MQDRKPSLIGGFIKFFVAACLVFGSVRCVETIRDEISFIRGDDFTSDEIDCSKARAQPILDAIHAFKAARGVYPPSLDAVAAFANITIPNCCMNDMPYRYGVSDDGTYFSLTFAASDGYYPCWYWDSRIQGWHADQ